VLRETVDDRWQARREDFLLGGPSSLKKLDFAQEVFLIWVRVEVGINV